MDIQSINSFYIKAIDYNFYKSLELPIAKRLYEILDLRFYGLKNKSCYKVNYSKLCQLLPIIPQKYFSRAVQILAPSHEKLIAEKFLARVSYEKSGKSNNFNILYYPGQKVTLDLIQPKLIEEPKPKSLPEPKKEINETQFSPEENKLCEKISENIKIRKDTVYKLIVQHKLEKVKKVYEYALDTAKENPAGLFIRALENGYVIPNKKELKEISQFKQDAVKCYQGCYGNCGANWTDAKGKKNCCYWCRKFDNRREQEEKCEIT